MQLNWRERRRVRKQIKGWEQAVLSAGLEKRWDDLAEAVRELNMYKEMLKNNGW